MRRIVWVAVTILIMICILGYGLHTMKRIDRVNQERREKEAGERFASQIAVVTETQTIWGQLRAGQETTTTVAGTDENGSEAATSMEPSESMTGDVQQTETETVNHGMVKATLSAQEADPPETDLPAPADEQTTAEPVAVALP